MVTLSVGSSNLSSFYSGASTVGSSTNTLSGAGLTTQDNMTPQIASSLLNSISQTDTSTNDTVYFPTNIQQTVQEQVILATNTNLAQTLSQLAGSTVLAPLTQALQTLSGAKESTLSSQSLTSLASSMQVLKDITNDGTLTSNPSMAQSLLKSYTTSTNLTPPGSLVNTSA